MKSTTLFLAVLLQLILSMVLFAQESGQVRLLGHFIPPQGGAYVAGCWGWTDSTTNREYALLGSFNGTSIVEITDPGNMVERDFIPGASSGWHELQTYSHYAYVVSEGGLGVQIIDLSYLPDSAHLVKNFNYSNGGKNISRGHTNQIRDGILYLNGCANWGVGGVVIFSLTDPENPTYLGEYEGHYVHDSFARNDTLFCATINNGGIDIVDVTDKANPTLISRFTYPGAGTHNCATTTDGKYLFTTDEVNTTPKTLKIWDLSKIDSVKKVTEYQGDPGAIVHNVFVKENIAFMSYYTAGLKIIDITDPEHPIELGGYDTYPGIGGGYAGAWSTYPFFPSGKIIIGDMQTGLYVVDMNSAAPHPPTTFRGYSDFQTPSSAILTWIDPTTLISGSLLENYTIHIFRDGEFIAIVDSGIQQFTDTGLTLHKKYRYTIKAVVNSESSAVSVSEIYAGGHPQPQSPSNFSILSTNGGAQLSWLNPKLQIDNTPLNDLSGIYIFRDDHLIDSVFVSTIDTGASFAYIDSSHGYHYYKILAFDNENPRHESPLTDNLFGYAGIVSTSFSETFESGSNDLYRTGTWDTTHSIAYSGNFSITDSPQGNYPPSSISSFMLPPVIATATSVLSFYQIGIIGSSDFGFIEVSTDNKVFNRIGVTVESLYPQWQDHSADSGDWRQKTYSLSAYAGDTITIRFILISDPGTTRDGWYLDDITVGSTTGIIENHDQGIPVKMSIEQNYPNPFNPTTNFKFQIVDFGLVTLRIYDIVGREVAAVVNDNLHPGTYTASWDANGQPSGIYYYQLTSGSGSETKKLILVK